MSRSTRSLWFNLLLASAALFAMAAITAGSGLGKAGIILTWAAILPLGLGVYGLADGVREEMKTGA